MGSAEAETRRVEMDGNTEVQRLQELVESLPDEIGVLQRSAVEGQVPSKVVADMRVMVEGLERVVEQAGGSSADGMQHLGEYRADPYR